MGGWCLNVNLVIGFGPSLGLALWPRAKPIKNCFCFVVAFMLKISKTISGRYVFFYLLLNLTELGKII